MYPDQIEHYLLLYTWILLFLTVLIILLNYLLIIQKILISMMDSLLNKYDLNLNSWLISEFEIAQYIECVRSGTGPDGIP